jgi:hypothetical protein
LCAAHGAFYLFEEIRFVTEKAQCVEVAWVPSPPPPASCAQVAQESNKLITVWFEDSYLLYDPENKVLRTTHTGYIIEGIKAGTYEVRDKETRRMINIELREVQSNYALPPPAPSAQVFRQIQLSDITIRDGEWSIRRGLFFQTGACTVSLDNYTLENVCYGKTNFLEKLNSLYKKTVQ